MVNSPSVEYFSGSSPKIVYYGIEMRAFFNSLMAALVVVALFWGNCFSCPQVLLAAQKHSCCPHGKSKADPNECKTQGLRNFVKADPGVQAAPALPAATIQVAPPAQLLLPVSVVDLISPQFTPPDLLPLRI